jgi:predicted permease
MLSSAGALLGLIMAYLLTMWLARQGSIALPLLTNVTVDSAALLWTLLITLSVALLFGLAPAGSVFGRDLQSALRDGGRGAIAGRQHERTRTVLVVSEVALACVLLVGAGLLLRSFINVLDVDLGFQPSRAAVIKVDYDLGGDRQRLGPVVQETLRGIQSIPGVESAGITDMLPLGRNRSWGLRAKGLTYPKDQSNSAIVRIITPGLLSAMGIRLQQGRDFTWNDTGKGDPVVIINQTAARHYWQGEDPARRPALINGKEHRVIGVVADVREHGLEDKVGPEMYLPVTQSSPEGAELVIRTSLPPAAIASTVLARLRAINPAQPAAELRPLQHIVDKSVSPRRFFVLLVSCFGALGLILASLGIYGVISYSVTRQTQEIGIRMALGATAPQVQAGVIGKALKLAGMGVVAGAIGSVAAARWIEALLFGTKPTDPWTFLVIVLLLVTVALLAGYLPARRASRIDPMAALRNS